MKEPIDFSVNKVLNRFPQYKCEFWEFFYMLGESKQFSTPFLSPVFHKFGQVWITNYFIHIVTHFSKYPHLIPLLQLGGILFQELTEVCIFISLSPSCSRQGAVYSVV